jgi:heme/copper-type cytochrome/quinol oxidase subunit 4
LRSGSEPEASLLASLEDSYGKQTLSTLGSILLVFAICAFSTAWCDVASATCVVHECDESWGRVISRVRRTYKWMSLVHVPFALVFSIHDYEFVAASVNLTVMLMYGVWLAFGTLVVLSGLAFVQWYIARACFAHVDGARGLQHTALINMVQQLCFDLIIAVYIVLYASDTTNDGDHIAAYHYLAFIAFWGMHVQVVLLFAVLGNTDPLYSQDDFASLLKAAAGSTDNKLPTTIGSPCGKGDGVVATDV